MKKLYVIISIVQCFQLHVAAQTKRCSSAEHLEQLTANNPAFAQKRLQSEAASQQWIAAHGNDEVHALISIPVVFHLLWNDSSQYLDDSIVLSQLEVINEDYQRNNPDTGETPLAFRGVAANCGIEFCLATRTPSGQTTNGIIHKFTSVPLFSQYEDPKFSSNGGDDIWEPSHYLNVWVAAFSNPNFLGLGTFPGGDSLWDGIVINYKACGRIGSQLMTHYNKGRSLTHEIGHWLNLIHVWGDDGGTCASDDLIADTPIQAGETYGCPSYPKTDSCSSSFPGIMFMNYMDYTDDECMNIFTNGQKIKMLSTLNIDRSSILSSHGCIGVGIEENELKNDVTVFPNPASDHITVYAKVQILSFEISNALGSLADGYAISQAAGFTQTVDVSLLPAGIYFLRLHAAEGDGVFKIVKE
jgi:hypothetical protein